MNKLFLSVGVIFGFAIYSLSQQRANELSGLVSPLPTAPPVPSSAGMPAADPPQTASPSQSTGPTTTPVPMGMNGQGMGMGMRQGKYKDGTYTGQTADAFYGNIQVQAVVSNGQLTDVQFLQYPNDRRTSIEINTYAMPILKQEAIAVQGSNVDIVSGATDSSMAFQQSLGSALSQAL